MKIWWRGHASFVIETLGKRILTDPYGSYVGYPMHPITADIVTISHEHRDHNDVPSVSGNPLVIRGTFETEIDGIFIRGVNTFHDTKGGKERGSNKVFIISSEGLQLVHLGDLGHPLSPQQVQAIGPVDILMVPVGGTYTIDAAGAAAAVRTLKPKIVIPMHYLTQYVTLPIEPVEKFTSLYGQVVQRSFLEVEAAFLGPEMQVVLLEYQTSG